MTLGLDRQGQDAALERRRAMADCLEEFVNSKDWRGAVSKFFHQHEQEAKAIVAAARKPLSTRRQQGTAVPPRGGRGIYDQQEHAHAYHEVFRQYSNLLEIELSRYLAKEGYVTPEEAFKELQGLPRNEQLRLVSIDVIEAALEYSDFMRFMADYSQLYLTYTRPRDRSAGAQKP